MHRIITDKEAEGAGYNAWTGVTSGFLAGFLSHPCLSGRSVSSVFYLRLRLI
jgi:biotin transporter BioY